MTNKESSTASNVSSVLKRRAHSPISKWLKGRDPIAVRRLVNHPLFESGMEKLLNECSAEWPKLFSNALLYALRALAGKSTANCFAGPVWGYRDRDFDNWCAANQSSTIASDIAVLTLMTDWTFAEAATSVLNVSPQTPIVTLWKLLKERRHTMTLPQLEFMAEATEGGENTGMVTNGWGNFAFVENVDGSVSVAHVYRDDGDSPWNAYVMHLAQSRRWHGVFRLIVCNLDPSKLGLSSSVSVLGRS